MNSYNYCPECVNGKTVNCVGAALNNKDNFVPCRTAIINRAQKLYLGDEKWEDLAYSFRAELTVEAEEQLIQEINV